MLSSGLLLLNSYACAVCRNCKLLQCYQPTDRNRIDLFVIRQNKVNIFLKSRSVTHSGAWSCQTVFGIDKQWRNYGRQWRQSPQGAPGKGAPRHMQTAMFFLFCLITKFCHVLWLPMTLHSIHFAQYAHALPLTIIS